MSLLYFILVYRMRCKYVSGQCCPNANSNASIEIGLRAEDLRADAVKHDTFIDY